MPYGSAWDLDRSSLGQKFPIGANGRFAIMSTHDAQNGEFHHFPWLNFFYTTPSTNVLVEERVTTLKRQWAFYTIECVFAVVSFLSVGATFPKLVQNLVSFGASVHLDYAVHSLLYVAKRSSILEKW